MLYDEETVTDVYFTGAPDKTDWDRKKLKNIFILIPDKKALMIRNDSGATVKEIRDLLIQKFHFPFINPQISTQGKALESESFDR